MFKFVYIVVVSPILFPISVPLVFFAICTTVLAFYTLFIRALIVYAELALVILQNSYNSQISRGIFQLSDTSASQNAEESIARHKSRRSSEASGSSNGGSLTPKAPGSSGFGVYGGGGVARDFEGIGGWEIGALGDDDWTNLNSRLELPVAVDRRSRNHFRSNTSGSLATISLPLKLFARSRPSSMRAAESMSNEGCLPSYSPSKSTTALDTAGTSRTLPRRKSSSGSSYSSARSMSLVISNT